MVGTTIKIASGKAEMAPMWWVYVMIPILLLMGVSVVRDLVRRFRTQA